jgi:O-methyltransferase involved in polyketide biosynthesis
VGAGRHERVSATAHVTAYTWHRLRMPYAEHFTTWRGFVGFWSFRVLLEGWGAWLSRSPLLAEVLGYRHRLIDAAAARHAPDVLVEIPGGFSRRAVTWAADHGVRAIEIDLPHVIAAKGALVEAAGLSDKLGGRHSLVAADVLGDGFAETLRALIGDARRPVVVIEGLLVYFPPEARRTFLTSVAAALHGTDALVLADIYTQERRDKRRLGAKVLKVGVNLVTRGQGWQPAWADWNAVEETWRHAGFDPIGVLDPAEFPDLTLPLTAQQAPGVVLTAGVPEGAQRASSG